MPVMVYVPGAGLAQESCLHRGAEIIRVSDLYADSKLSQLADCSPGLWNAFLITDLKQPIFKEFEYAAKSSEDLRFSSPTTEASVGCESGWLTVFL